MFSGMGDIGVKLDFPTQPCFLRGYDIREQPQNLEMITKFPLTQNEWSMFQRVPNNLNVEIPKTSDQILFRFDRKMGLEGTFSGLSEIPISMGYMKEMIVNGENRTGNIYTGKVSCVDCLEGCGFENDWIMHPFQNIYQLNGRNYAFKVRRPSRDDFFGEEFTLNATFNYMIQHYVMHGVLEFNPKLPELGTINV